MMRIMAILGAGLIGLMHPTTTHADPLDFTFSFTGTVPPGSVAGTVTGEIFGLTNNATGQAATNVVVDSYPAGLVLPPTPLTIFTGTLFNLFTVSNDEITAADYRAFDTSMTAELDLNVGNINNELFNNNTGQNTRNSNGLAGVTFSLVQTNVPEPASLAIFGTALAGLGLIRRHRRRKDV